MSNRIRMIAPGTYGAPWSRKCTKTKHKGNRYGGRHAKRALRRYRVAVAIGEHTERLVLSDPSYVAYTGRGA